MKNELSSSYHIGASMICLTKHAFIKYKQCPIFGIIQTQVNEWHSIVKHVSTIKKKLIIALLPTHTIYTQT